MTRLSGGLVALLLVLIVAGGAALRIGAAVSHGRVDFDEGRYFDNAVSLTEGKGLATHTVSLFFGDPPRPPRPEDISSPLFPLILAALFLVAGPSFVLGKTVSVLVSVAMIPLAFLLGRRLFGPGVGLAAAALLALQPDQAIVGAWAMTEPLYGALILATLLVAAPLVTGSPWTWARTVAAGAMLGILFLARQNGAAVAVALALLVTWDPAGRAGPFRRRVLMVAGMAAVAFTLCLPWFVRNNDQLGSPTFSRLKNVAWAEHARSLYDPAVEEPSMSRYAETHGTGGLARNLGRRVLRVTRTLLTAEAGPFRWLALLGLAAPFIPALRARSLLMMIPVGLTAALLLGVAPWSGALPRYFLPVRALLYLAGAAVAAHLGRLAVERWGLAARQGALAAAVVAASLGWAVLSSHQVYADYLSRDETARHAAAMEAADWISDTLRSDEVLMEGGLLHQYAWRFRRGVVWIPLGSARELFEIARRYDAGYLAVTPEALRFRPDLGRYWQVDGPRLVPVAVPAALQPAYDRGDSGVIIYRINRIDKPGPEQEPAGEMRERTDGER